jgi:hypothetical protein
VNDWLIAPHLLPHYITLTASLVVAPELLGALSAKNAEYLDGARPQSPG